MLFRSTAPTSSSVVGLATEGVATGATTTGAATTGATTTGADTSAFAAFEVFVALVATGATGAGAATTTGAVSVFVDFLVVFTVALILVLSEERLEDMERE